MSSDNVGFCCLCEKVEQRQKKGTVLCLQCGRSICKAHGWPEMREKAGSDEYDTIGYTCYDCKFTTPEAKETMPVIADYLQAHLAEAQKRARVRKIWDRE